MSARTKTLWTFVITSIALFMVTLDNLVVTTAIPVIRKDLNASLESLEWTVNAYTLTFAVLLLTGAALGDRFGRRRVFAIGIGIFTLGSIAAALAPTVEALNLARALQGLGGAIVMPLTLTILSAAVPTEKRGLALGAWGGISGLAVAFGPVVGGAVVEGLSWQWIFWLNVPIGARADPARALAPEGVARPGRQARPARSRPRERRPLRDRLGPDPRQRPGLGEPGDRRVARARARARGGVRRVGAAHGRADAADALLPQARVRARERLRRCSCSSACSARSSCSRSSSRPCRATRRSAPGCGSCRGRSRRCSSPRSRARCRTGSRGRCSSGSASSLQAAALAWIGARLDADRGVLLAHRAVRARRHRHGALLRPDGEHRPLGRAAARRRARPPAPTTRSASSAASSASRCWRRCSRASVATRAARRSATA